MDDEPTGADVGGPELLEPHRGRGAVKHALRFCGVAGATSIYVIIYNI